jgi:hypothetical protein
LAKIRLMWVLIVWLLRNSWAGWPTRSSGPRSSLPDLLDRRHPYPIFWTVVIAARRADLHGRAMVAVRTIGLGVRASRLPAMSPPASPLTPDAMARGSLPGRHSESRSAVPVFV